MKVIEVNRPAISKPCSIINGDVSAWHRQYMTENRVISVGSESNPVFRLSKDYENSGLKFNISLLIDSTDVGKAEEFMQMLAASTTEEKYQEYVRSHQPFLYLDERYKA